MDDMSAHRDGIRRAIAARENGREKVRSATTAVSVASVVAVGALALALPGSTHKTTSTGSSSTGSTSTNSGSSSTSSGSSSGSSSSGSSSSGSSNSGSSSSSGISSSSTPSSSSGSTQVTSGGS